ncbi:PKD domain-containing protein [Chitinophaga vietnamensis]|uniref:PKD domain-containing protein n=1 Tax=Chitinophaga vietnamensis TaxID=2593957 RepID=UPI0011781055|nr:PKD domain-containing protein [Chitinophaga vietnamensis]
MKYLQAKCLRALLLLLALIPAEAALSQQAGFNYTASPANLCAPVTITFQNTSTSGAISYSWDFGDGRTSHDVSPQITYSSGGPKKVTLTVQYSSGASTYWRDFVAGSTPVVDFNANVTQSCKPYTANFTDLTPGAVSHTWDFGDGSAPVTTDQTTISHSYASAGKFSVTLTAANINGCASSLSKNNYINVSLPDITMSGPVSGCVPYTASFSASSTNTVNDPVLSYKWDFGDGNSQVTNTGSVTHNYAQTGTYSVGLTVTTQQQCTVTKTFDKLVHTGNPPSNVSFSVSPTSTCTGDPVRLLANANYVDTYSWDFGDGAQLDTSSNDIKHAFNANGTLTVKMKAGSNGCYTSAPPAMVTISGPVSKFSFVRSCTDKSQFIFTNNSTNTTAQSTYEWDFGDNSPLVFTKDAVHNYTTPGKYTVRLTVRENGGPCNHSSFQTLQYFKADFTTGVSTVCRGSKVTYEVLNVPLTLVASYTWNLGDGTSYNTTLQSYTKTWQSTGTFHDQLVIHYNDPAYCDDVVDKPGNISIMAPQADFNTSGNNCAGQPVNFVNTSVTSPNTPITNYSWDLGNGLSSASQTPPPTKYTASGGYNVKLVITDARNCMDSITKAINVNPTPFIRVSSTQSKICEGASTTLNALSDGTVQWLSNNNISCVFCNTPTVSPVANARYIAQASNANGCTMLDSADISVVPKANLTVSKDTMVCYGSSVKLRAAGAAFYNWTPVDGLTNNTIAEPITTPSKDITYQVTGTNDPMCPAAGPLSVNISVKPVPSVDPGKDQTVTVGTIVKLAATGSTDIVKWQWSPTDYLDCPTCPLVTAAVRKPITYSVTGTNAYGCTKSGVVNVDLICNTDVVFIPNTFSPNGDGQNDIFYPRGKGIRFIKSFRIFNRWGQEVYHREQINIDDVSAGWNGNFNGKPQPSDVYIYFIEAYCDTNEFFQLKGNVTLLR